MYHHCPRCNASVYRESKQGWVRYPALLIFLRKLRCIRCSRTFWRFAFRPPPPVTG